MTIPDVSPMVRQASSHSRKGWGWAFVDPAAVLELAACVKQLADAERRLAAIAKTVAQTWTPFCDNNREVTRAALHKIETLAKDGTVVPL